MQQTIKALDEAEKHKGPSIVIAYAPCITHGIKSGMKNSIKEFRIAKGMTQKELAEEVGIARLFMGEVERGNAVPSVKNAIAIAKALGKTVEEVFPDGKGA